MTAARHWIEPKAECNYCGDSSKCYECDGKGYTEDNGECEDCNGFGACAHCVDGVEQWLFFDAPGGGVRGSCLNRKEADAFLTKKALPSWWLTYHGVTLA